MASGTQKQPLTTLTRVVVLVACYFVGGLVGRETMFLSGSATLVWPPAGIALAAILLFGYRFWPGVALGAVLFSCMNGVPLGFFTLGTALGNTIGAVVCAFLLQRFVAFDNAMERTRDATGYIGWACFLGTTVNAAFNVVSLAYSGAVAWDDLFPSIVAWWVPNALAGLVVAPFILTWATRSSTRWNTRLVVEAGVCGAGLVGGTLISFDSWFVYGIPSYPLAYLPLPFLVWGALRFGQRGATAGTLLVSVLAIHSLLRGIGPFVTSSEKDSLMLLGSYIGILAVTNMLLAAASSERRAAERALAQREKQFRAVVEDQTDLICRFRPDGRITFVNEAFCRFHGKAGDALIGTNALQALFEEDAAVLLSHTQFLSADEPAISFDRRLHSTDDQPVWHQYRVRRLFQDNGDTLEFQAVIQDITQRKRLEAKLVQSQKLETVGKLAGGVAHEFNSILTAIIGQSELLLGGLPAESPLTRNVSEICRAAGRAATLTRQLLAYGRKQALEPTNLNLNGVLANMEGMLRHVMGSAVSLRIVPAPDLRAAKADTGQIEQVIMEIAGNAREAMPNGGTLTLETTNVSFGPGNVGGDPEVKPGDYVSLAITDTGTGMSAEVEACVFEPFFTTKDVGQGTGLGLATCYGIIKQSGGLIDIDSELGRGTTVKIYLPQASREAEALPRPLAPLGLPRGKETVLLVEDDPALREMAAAVLSRLGYLVLAAADGMAALGLVERRGAGVIDLMFFDGASSQMKAGEVSEGLLALHPETKILLASAHTKEAIVHQGSLTAGVALLQKPFTPSALALKVREVLDRQVLSVLHGEDAR